MWLQVVAVVAALTGSALAVPGGGPPAHCNYRSDRCYREVLGGPPGQPRALEHAKSDCASFFRATVTPCPVTRIHTTTQTSTAKTKTITSTKDVTVNCKTETDFTTTIHTDLIRKTQTVTGTGTTTKLETKIVATDTAHVTVTDHTVSTATVTSTTTVTVNVTPVAFPKRDVVLKGYPNCHAVTSTASHIPGYAKACDRRSDYSSACSCLGAPHHTQTLSPKTSVESKTVTTTVTPKVTKHTTKTIDNAGGAKTVTVTKTAKTTKTIVVTTTVGSLHTVTSTVDATATVTSISTDVVFTRTTTTTVKVSATVSAFPIVESNGPNAGQYLTNQDSADSILTWDSNVNKALFFRLDSSSRLTSGGSLIITNVNGPSFVFVDSAAVEGPGMGPLTCSVAPASFVLYCVAGSGPDNLFMTSNIPVSESQLLFASSAWESIEGLVPISVAFVGGIPN